MIASAPDQAQVRTAPLPDSEHFDRPWRIHEVAPDFRLEDVWALRTPGGPDDLPRLAALIVDPATDDDLPLLVRALLEIRSRLGLALRLDTEGSGTGSRVASLRDRLPEDLRDGPTGPDAPDEPFSPVYLTDREWVIEIANRTVHCLLHVGWVRDETGWHGQIAVLNKPNGLLGKAYMAFIQPFRYHIVWPGLVRTIARDWQRQHGGAR